MSGSFLINQSPDQPVTAAKLLFSSLVNQFLNERITAVHPGIFLLFLGSMKQIEEKGRSVLAGRDHLFDAGWLKKIGRSFVNVVRPPMAFGSLFIRRGIGVSAT
jgi:hypothetical protein